MWIKNMTSGTKPVTFVNSAVSSGNSSQQQQNGQSNNTATSSGGNRRGDESSLVGNEVTPTRRNQFDDDVFHMESIIALEKECQETLEKILQDPFSNAAVQYEQQFWTDCFIRRFKQYLNAFMADFMIGYYRTLCETLDMKYTPRNGTLRYYRPGAHWEQYNRPLLYMAHIRLGELYRYIESRSNARFYYQQALYLDPRRGIAYNCLSLCTPITKPYKLLYMFVMAEKASVDPVKSTANFRKAISRINNSIFDHFRSKLNLGPVTDEANQVSLPANGADWFYLAVISIYLNDFDHTLLATLDCILQLTQQNEEDSIDLDYSLMALEVSLDWILKDRENLMKRESLEQTLRLIGQQFRSTINLDDTETNARLLFSHKIALKHNYILRYFGPLKEVYDKLHYYDDMRQYVISRDRKILTTRLIHKLVNF